MKTSIKLSDFAQTLEEARGVIDRLEEKLSKQVDYSTALQRAIERHCEGGPVQEDVAMRCPHHAQMLNAFRANAGDDRRSPKNH